MTAYYPWQEGRYLLRREEPQEALQDPDGAGGAVMPSGGEGLDPVRVADVHRETHAPGQGRGQRHQSRPNRNRLHFDESTMMALLC